jgi:hypothetical protein
LRVARRLNSAERQVAFVLVSFELHHQHLPGPLLRRPKGKTHCCLRSPTVLTRHLQPCLMKQGLPVGLQSATFDIGWQKRNPQGSPREPYPASVVSALQPPHARYALGSNHYEDLFLCCDTL